MALYETTQSRTCPISNESTFVARLQIAKRSHGGFLPRYLGRRIVRSLFCPPVRRFLDGGDDVGISGATADVAAHPLSNLRFRADVTFLDQRDGRDDLAGSAIAALQGVVLDETRLDRVQLATPCQALDGDDLAPLLHHRQRHARVDAPAVDKHGTRAALTAVASLLGARKTQALAQASSRV